jgi:hypothetical protein
LLAEAENSMPSLIVQCIGTSPSSVCNLQVRLSVSNQTDRHIGPLQISMSQDDAQGVSRAIVVNGLWTMVVPQLEPFASTDFNLSLVATAVGVQKITGIAVVDVRDGKPYDTLLATEVFVEPE